jgi:flagellar capping protein FliD
MNDNLAAKEAQLRSEFTQMQTLINQLNNQQSFLSSFGSF